MHLSVTLQQRQMEFVGLETECFYIFNASPFYLNLYLVVISFFPSTNWHHHMFAADNS